MADYRSVQTRMWREDDWFQELDVEARLFWIYLFTNPSASPAGIYRLPLRTMAFESGVSYEQAKQLMEEFSAGGKAHYDDGVVWVVNMRRLQFPTLVDGSKEWQTAIRIQRDIDMIPDRCSLKSRYLAHSGYPTIYETVESGKTVKRVSIQYPHNDNTPLIPHASPINTQSVNSNITVTKLNETATATKPNGRGAEDALIDPELAQALGKWTEVFAGTPHEGNAPVSQMTKWLAYYGPDVLCHMIGQAKGKDNPVGWMYTTYDNWRKDGEVAPYVLKQVEAGKPKAKRKMKIQDPFTGEITEVEG